MEPRRSRPRPRVLRPPDSPRAQRPTNRQRRRPRGAVLRAHWIFSRSRGPASRTESSLRPSVLDLLSGITLFIGEGRAPFFTDRNHVAFAQPSNPENAILSNVENGESTTVPFDGAIAGFRAWQDALRGDTPDGYHVVTDDADYQIIDGATGTTLFEGKALRVLPAGEGAVVVATESTDGLTNIFLVRLPDGTAEFVASAATNGSELPLAADDGFVAWVDGFCGDSGEGDLWVFDRTVSALTRLAPGPEGWGRLGDTPAGLIGIGDFGASALFDPSNLKYATVLPHGAPIAWSPFYRYAAFGAAAGQEDPCWGTVALGPRQRARSPLQI